MTSVVFYFQVHQPYRLARYSFFDIGSGKDYFDDGENERILRRVAERCYQPMNKILLEAIDKTEGEFRCSFSLSGTVLEQMESWAPEALQSFVDLAQTGCVEFLCETSRHSLAFLEDREEFQLQILEQRQRVEELFGRRPVTFRNTELVIDNDIARLLEDMDFQVLLGEGADHLLGWRSPHQVYRPKGCERLALLLRDYIVSDDIAFRFSNKEWDGYPLMADAFAEKLDEVPEEAAFIGLFMDYETFGEHQWADTGILDFMEFLPGYVLENPRFRFQTPCEVAAANPPAETLDIPRHVSWADAERDLSAWLGNHMQRAAHSALYAMAGDLRGLEGKEAAQLMDTWRKLTTSDHVYYMCTKWFSDGDVHKYFSPYETPHDAFITFMNVVEDLSTRVKSLQSK